MKCQKCSNQAVVHLTEVIHDATGTKRTMESHLCLGHAAQAGLVAPGSEILPQVLSSNPSAKDMSDPEAVGGIGGIDEIGAAGTAGSGKSPLGADAALPTSIVGKTPSGNSLAVGRGQRGPGDSVTCPFCALSWANFKQKGLMGCPHDYEIFQARLLPLLKRAQEGAAEHVGKVPPSRKTPEGDRHAAALRLKRELERAVHAENYEQAAHIRDELRQLGSGSN